MNNLHVEQCELTYEGAYVTPALSLLDSPGRLCDLLLDALESFGCTSADLVLEEGELRERGVGCEVEELDTRVTLYRDWIEINFLHFWTATAPTVGTMFENVL